jgi:hypothetical protein
MAGSYVLKKAHRTRTSGATGAVTLIQRFGSVERLAECIGRTLERRGVLVRDAESSFLELEPAAGAPMADLLGHSITYRVAIGPRAGQKVFSLRTVRARDRASATMFRASAADGGGRPLRYALH